MGRICAPLENKFGLVQVEGLDTGMANGRSKRQCKGKRKDKSKGEGEGAAEREIEGEGGGRGSGLRLWVFGFVRVSAPERTTFTLHTAWIWPSLLSLLNRRRTAYPKVARSSPAGGGPVCCVSVTDVQAFTHA